MNTESCLLSYYISDNKIINSCDFNYDKLNNGYVIYEVIRIIDGTPIFFEEHLVRFLTSIKNSHLEYNINKHIIADQIFNLIETNRVSNGNIRFQITIDELNKVTFHAWIAPSNYPRKELYESGISLSTFNLERNNPNIKSYRPQIKKQITDIIIEKDVYEVLLVNSSNNITEGSKSNIFFIKDQCVFTPKTKNVLPGITRQKIAQIAIDNNICYKEVDINSSSITDFEAAFISGTSPKVLPISRIDNTTYNTDNLIVNKLLSYYNFVISEYISSFSRTRFLDKS